MANQTSRNAGFTIRAPFEGEPDKPIAAVAYLFDRSGALLASEALSEGKAQFSLRQLPRGARLLIGPAIDGGKRAGPPTLAMLERLNAYAPKWQFEQGRRQYEIDPIPDYLWPSWHWCRCRVRGRLVKRVRLPGGEVVELPVCHARVHICEVDRLWWVLTRLPDPEIVRLRDELVGIIHRPLPWPPGPDPDPRADPWPIDIGEPIRDLANAASRRLQLAATASLIGRGEEIALNPQPLPPIETAAFAAVGPNPLAQQMNPAMQFALTSHSTQVVRRSLIDNIELIRPLICLWPWLHPWFYVCDELRVVTTDEDGGFDTTIWYPRPGDKPDLYFWVEYSIGGVWTTVYRPPIPCNTWWDYPCGTEVRITITDPRVHGCGHTDPLPGKQVVVKSIGRQVSMGEINREPSVVDPAADPLKAGTVKAGWIHASKESPFGATLEPRVDFGQGLKPAGITHYRWSYRPLGSTLDSDWVAIDVPVFRHYRETTPIGQPVIYNSVKVGPVPGFGQYYYEIEPDLPAGGEDWEVLDEGYDLASAYWNTVPLATGKYELKLELFRNVGGTMTRVDLTAESVDLFQIVDPAPLTSGTYNTDPATHDRTLFDGASHVAGFRLVLHLDNRQCFGTINPATIAPGNNDTKCGFLEYSPGASAVISFRASHPANYASFDFHVTRVATPLPSAGASGLVDAVSANGYSRTGDQFSKSLTVTLLLNEQLPVGETPCIRAAFAESLRVYALATDGYQRLSGYDAPVTSDPAQVNLRAFAITPI
ncbi:MAG: hypothetical protein QOE79_2629 [Sphingomonadales bacterium]|nr:hypothetical protein [Sphingomonadales bacterium]MEA3050746.1 hypothetical protein [Sphingomonadales bacterium]